MTTSYEYEKGRRAGITQAVNAIACGQAPLPHTPLPGITCDNCTDTIPLGQLRYGQSCSAECWADMHGWPDPEADDFEEEDDGEEPK